jgi:hypothetical protein
MPLISLWKSAPDAVAEMTIQQIVGTAGDGRLLDRSACSAELRQYLRGVSSADLARYVEQCLGSTFDKSGMVLQDLVNELGRRLEYEVTDGRYQGAANEIGHDGLWHSPEKHALVVEVKTTDAYRISLDTIAGYRTRLGEAGRIDSSSSVLIVVGRQDTGELEAQVRGSRHAWDIRLISADALVKLVQLKENTEAVDTGRKIRSLLTPMEYTRLDRMIDVMFTAAKDVEEGTAGIQDEDEDDEPEASTFSLSTPVGAKGSWQFTDGKLLQAKRDAIVAAMGAKTGVSYIKKSRALAWDASHSKRVVSTLSKRYARSPATPYWYAYHPPWHAFLQDGTDAHLLLGCMDLPFAFALPLSVLTPLLDAMNTTERNGEHYWHLKLGRPSPGRYTLLLPKRSDALPIDEYRLPLTESGGQT